MRTTRIVDGPTIIPRPIEDGHVTGTREVVALVRELDRMLAPHDCGNTAGYAMWRDRLAGVLDVHELELAGRHIIESGGPVVAT